jgi:hypothetical protein
MSEKRYFKSSDGNYVLEPFKHDCDSCKWVGWISMGDDRLGNMYICNGKDVVIRFSDEPSDYWSKTMSKGNAPHAIGGVSQATIDHLEAKKKWFNEE